MMRAIKTHPLTAIVLCVSFVAPGLFRANKETFGSLFEFRKLRADLS